MPRVRQAWLALGFGGGILAAAVAIGPNEAAAQAPPTPPDFASRALRPVLDGDPANPPRFSRVPPRADREPVPFSGYVPKFGNLPGSGAGLTGFVSSGAARKKRRVPVLTARPIELAQQPGGTPILAGSEKSGPFPPAPATPPPSPASPPPPPGTPRIAATSTRIGGPALPGGVLDEGASPRRRATAETDPYEPLGLRLGGFMVHSAIEVLGGYDSNPSRSPGGSPPSAVIDVIPELHARSEWSRHEVSADVLASYSKIIPDTFASRPNLDAKVNGRIDVTRNDRVDLQGRLLLSTDYPGSPNVPLDVVKLPIYTDVGVTAGYGHTFNRLDLSLKGSFDRFSYQDSILSDGSSSSNADRDYNRYGGQLRGSYEFNPGFKPFVALDVDARIHDLPVDRSGFQRDSVGVTPRVGATLDLGGTLKGEVSVGYTNRTYKDPTFADLRGLMFDSSLVWRVSGLTNVSLAAQSFVDESTVPGVSGVLRDAVTLQVEHAFRRWLIATARIGDEIDEYQNSPRVDHRRQAAVGLTYKLTRTLQIKGEARHEWLVSNIPGQNYSANVFLLGFRAQN